MKTMKFLSIFAGLALAVMGVDSFTNPIVIKNYKMYDVKTGKYFGVRGVDYYPRANAGVYDINNYDFFTDDHEDIWGPDIEQLAQVGANAIRLYAVDPSKSHSKFLCALRDRGIYVLVDLAASCENCAITSDSYPTCYPPELKTRGEAIITEFAKYDNILGFSAGNEVNHVVRSPEDNAPCQKKFLRDMRAFINRCSSFRQIPVGVVSADTDRKVNALYYSCRTDPNDQLENAEWFGLNVYQHCDGSVKTAAQAGGYQKLLSDFTSYKLNIPVMLTEFGCINPSFPTVGDYKAQRTWLQAGWIHNKDFRNVFNGGFVFEYSTEKANSQADSPWPFTTYGGQNYGLGYFTPENCNHKDIPCEYKRMPNYDALTRQYNSTDYSDEVAMANFIPDSTRTTPVCPEGFAKLSEITWPSDNQKSLSCPINAQTYTCPNQETSGIWAKDFTDPLPTEEVTGTTTTKTGTGTSTGTTTSGKSNGNTVATTGEGKKNGVNVRNYLQSFVMSSIASIVLVFLF